jgi:diacylglycerol kinase (ATP)
MRAVIIANPAAGRGRGYKRLRAFLRDRHIPDWKIELLPTKCRGDAGRLAASLLDDPPDLLAVCGGDGTMMEVATSLPQPPFPVALLPAGTGNVLAHEIGIPTDPVNALPIALRRRVSRVDLPILHCGGTYRFLLMAGIGFDAFVNSRVKPGLKNRIGILAYYIGVLTDLLRYDFPEFRVRCEGREYSSSTCIVANARGYGGGLVLTPDASMTDGRLDLLILRRSTRFAFAEVALLAKLGISARGRIAERIKSASVEIHGPKSIPVQVDGETVGWLPAKISLSGEMFPLVIP